MNIETIIALSLVGFFYLAIGYYLATRWFLPKVTAIYHKRHGYGLTVEEATMVSLHIIFLWPLCGPYEALVGLKRYARWCEANPKT